MISINKPHKKPINPNFSSGPCSKRPGWTPNFLVNAANGRSHRSTVSKQKLQQVIDLTRHTLELPKEYLIGIVPASDTGAVEMALWSLLGEREVTVLNWESFGNGWAEDVIAQLGFKDAQNIKVPYGHLPDLSSINFSNDVIFTWNGTTSGVRVPNADFIPADRQGLTICDATSAVFSQQLDYQKLDVVTYSWQKALGGEAAHGMIILSPRAVERLETFTPDRPIPKIFRLTKDGKIIDGIFRGETINTPSMLCVEDYLNTLQWAIQIGGLSALISRADRNTQIVSNWVERIDWIDFLAIDPQTRSNTSVCLKIIDNEILELSEIDQSNFAKNVVNLLEKEQVAYDIGAYRDAPTGFRIWTGPTIETHDIETLIPWIEWAYQQMKSELLN